MRSRLGLTVEATITMFFFLGVLVVIMGFFFGSFFGSFVPCLLGIRFGVRDFFNVFGGFCQQSRVLLPLWRCFGVPLL